ncbi:MAG: DNA/RNA non-specific endonuclease [Bacteroidota bacterium]
MNSELQKKSIQKNTATAAAHQRKGKVLEDNRTATVIQQQKNNTGLPNNLKSGIEQLSGHSLDDVKVHYNSHKPAQLNAHAYAQGNHIHVASGQEKYVPHEAWHVVQQKQGRVRPTKTVGSAKINDNASLEKEADVMGGKALQLKSIQQKKSLSATRYTNVIQLGKGKTLADRLKKIRSMGVHITKSSDKIPIKTQPKRLAGYTTQTFGGRTYYTRKDAAGRVIKFAGSVVYTTTPRVATPDVPNKRVKDQSGHLIAHSFGGPTKMKDNFVAMNKTANSKSGSWGKMEGYIRARLKQKGIKAWMSVRPRYAGTIKRPHNIKVSLTFNRSPYKIGFDVNMP